MGACKREGIQVDKRTDTLTLAKRVRYETGCGKAMDLRELYLPVRYGNKKDLYEKEASELYKQIREEIRREPETE